MRLEITRDRIVIETDTGDPAELGPLIDHAERLWTKLDTPGPRDGHDPNQA